MNNQHQLNELLKHSLLKKHIQLVVCFAYVKLHCVRNDTAIHSHHFYLRLWCASPCPVSDLNLDNVLSYIAGIPYSSSTEQQPILGLH